MDHLVLSFLMISIVFYFEIMFGTAGVKLGYSTRVCSIGPSKNKNCLFDANKSAKRRDGRLPCLKAIVSNAPLLRSIKDTDAWTDAPLCLCLANSTLDFLFIFFFNLFFHSSNYFVTKWFCYRSFSISNEEVELHLRIPATSSMTVFYVPSSKTIKIKIL